MTAPLRVSERDLHTLLGIVTDDRDDLPASGLPDSLLSDLLSVVRGDVVTFSGLDSGRQTYWFGQDVPAKDLSDRVQGFWAHYWDCPFSSYPDRTGDLRSVTKLSDFYSARQWHSAAIYSDYFRAQGVKLPEPAFEPPVRAHMVCLLVESVTHNFVSLARLPARSLPLRRPSQSAFFLVSDIRYEERDERGEKHARTCSIAHHREEEAYLVSRVKCARISASADRIFSRSALASSVNLVVAVSHSSAKKSVCVAS